MSLDFGLWLLNGPLDLSNVEAWHSLSLRPLQPFFDNVLLEQGGLLHILPLAVHLKYVLEDK